MVSTTTGGTTTVSEGWFFYNGQMVRFPGGTFGTIATGYAVYMVVSPTAGTLTYNDGSNPAVILDVTGVLTVLVNTTPTDASHFLLSALGPFGTGFGINNREQVWSTIVVSTDATLGGVTGTIYYKKDFTANTLQVRAVLLANNAQNFTASPGALYYNMGTLPAGYIPNNEAYFTGHYFVSFQIKDDLGISWIKQVNCGINTTGQIYVNWIKPDISITSYAINFNTTIPLD